MEVGSRTREVLVGLSFACALMGRAAAQEDSAYRAALADYRVFIQRKSLAKRCDARLLLARTGQAAAFSQLSGDYLRPEEPVEFVRSSIVAMASLHLAKPGLHAEWRKWRGEYDGPDAAWLWHQALVVEGRAGRTDWADVAVGDAEWPLRAAALGAGRVLLRRGRPRSAELEVIDAILDDLPRDEVAASVLRESALALFDTSSSDPLGAEHRVRLSRFVDAMEDRRCPVRSRLVLARLMARILGRDNLGPDPAAWRALIEGEGGVDAEIDYQRRRSSLRQTFFGIPDHSERVVFVIDSSDSMLEPLTPAELEALRPITGVEPGAVDAPRDRASARATEALDWSRIRTRFDAAREFLKLALRELDKDQSFAVVLFGTRAETLEATPRITKVSRRALARVFQELDAISAVPLGSPFANDVLMGTTEIPRPHGVLRGYTNLHGGLRLAFELTTRGRLDEGRADVDPRAFELGCDTIYLLSDGDPTWSDFAVLDGNDIGRAYDPETGRSEPSDRELYHYHAYGSARPFLVPDVQRLDLLRRVAIHTVALGEANDALLDEIAAIGGGRAIRIR